MSTAFGRADGVRPSTGRFGRVRAWLEKITRKHLQRLEPSPRKRLQMKGLHFLKLNREWKTRCVTPRCLGKKPRWEGGVNYKLDIFQKLGNGQLLWVKAIEGREEAHSELKQLEQSNPGDYFIYDARMGCAVGLAATVPS